MPQLLRDGNLDSALALARDGYAFIANRCRRYGTDAFETRLALRKVEPPPDAGAARGRLRRPGRTAGAGRGRSVRSRGGSVRRHGVGSRP